MAQMGDVHCYVHYDADALEAIRASLYKLQATVNKLAGNGPQTDVEAKARRERSAEISSLLRCQALELALARGSSVTTCGDYLHTLGMAADWIARLEDEAKTKPGPEAKPSVKDDAVLWSDICEALNLLKKHRVDGE